MTARGMGYGVMMGVAVLAGLLAGASSGLAAEITPGHLIFPNCGLNAIQEFDPATRTIVQTIPLPAPYTYSGPMMLSSALVRTADLNIMLNVRGSEGVPHVAVLGSSGQFVAAAPTGGGWLQQIQFDPMDPKQDTVIGGVPFLPEVHSVNPYSGDQSVRINRPEAGNFIGLAVKPDGQILAADYWTGEILAYEADGMPAGVFANVLDMTGSNELNGMTIDAAGNVYVSQNNSHHIVKLDANGGFLGLLISPFFMYPAHVFYNPLDDLLYVGNNGNGRLIIMQTNGILEDVVHMGGWGIGTGALVPEPATLCLLGLGGLLSRRRRR